MRAKKLVQQLAQTFKDNEKKQPTKLADMADIFSLVSAQDGAEKQSFHVHENKADCPCSLAPISM